MANTKAPWVKDKRRTKETRKVKMPGVPEKDTLSSKYKNRSTEIPTNSSLVIKRRMPWNKGIPLSEETKRKMSEAHKGKPATFRGRKHSIESQLKQSLAHKGKHPSEETRLKISKSVKRYFAIRAKKT